MEKEITQEVTKENAKENTKVLNYVEIGHRIKLLRMAKGMMQSDLAKALGMSQTHMSNIERGQVGVTLENIVRMTEIFTCGIDHIVFGTSQKDWQQDMGILKRYTLEDCVKALKALESLKK